MGVREDRIRKALRMEEDISEAGDVLKSMPERAEAYYDILKNQELDYISAAPASRISKPNMSVMSVFKKDPSVIQRNWMNDMDSGIQSTHLITDDPAYNFEHWKNSLSARPMVEAETQPIVSELGRLDSSMTTYGDIHPNYLSMTDEGLRQGVDDRLLMEALGRGQVIPAKYANQHMFNQSKRIMSNGKKSLMEMVERFMKTGKAGKIWQYVPLAGTGVAAYSAFKSGDAVAGALELADPTGISQSDPIEGGDLPEDEQMKRAEFNQLIKSRRALNGN